MFLYVAIYHPVGCGLVNAWEGDAGCGAGNVSTSQSRKWGRKLMSGKVRSLGKTIPCSEYFAINLKTGCDGFLEGNLGDV